MKHMKAIPLFLFFSLSGFVYGSCGEKESVIPPTPPVAAGEVFRTPAYLQNPSADAMTVMWITSVPCRSWVEFGTDPDRLQPVRSYDEGMMVANRKINKIRLEDLRPGTKYYYRACSQQILHYGSYKKEFGDTIRMPLAPFTTWDERDKDYTILVFNDIHKKTELFKHLMSLVGNEPYDLVIFNGDCFDDPEKESDIVDVLTEYCKSYGSDCIPSVFMRGNHEIRGACSVVLWDYLSKAGEHSYTAFTMGDTRFVLLDCGEDKPDDTEVYYGMNDFTQHRKDQAQFLQTELAKPEFTAAARKVLIHHIPIYGKAVAKFNPCKELWQPYLVTAGFDVSLNGHLHRYELIEKGASENNFPVVIGGGYKEENATVMILKKTGEQLNLRVVHAKGNTLFNRDL